jgi:hypothetical protein
VYGIQGTPPAGLSGLLFPEGPVVADPLLVALDAVGVEELLLMALARFQSRLSEASARSAHRSPMPRSPKSTFPVQTP